MQPLLQEKIILIYFKFIFVFVLFSKNILRINSFIFKTEKKVLKNDRKLKILYVNDNLCIFNVFHKQIIKMFQKNTLQNCFTITNESERFNLQKILVVVRINLTSYTSVEWVQI